MSPGALVLVGTPIGNLGDLSPRAVEALAAADTVVWFDLPRSVVMGRVIRRTLRRTITGEELWNGNREPLTNLTSRNMEKNIIVWAWKRHAVYRERYLAAAADPAWSHLEFVRIATDRDQEALLAGIRDQP